MRKYLKWSLFFTVCWWLLLLPKHHFLFSTILEPFQGACYQLICSVFGQMPFHEDSSGMYLLLFITPLLGLLFGLSCFIPRIKQFNFNPLDATRVVATYFLILVLWEYGWIKLTKMQFYLPEPNTVYTEFGQLSKDLAYWSVIGSSHSYVVFLGILEILAGILVLVKRTRFFGLLLTAGIFLNVLMVNVSFDISVKLFAFTLLGMTTVLLFAYPNQWRYLFQLPVKPTSVKQKVESPIKRWGRALVLSLMVVEVVSPAILSESLNDDTIPRPAYHGAYTIHHHPTLNQLFVHRRGYIIVENKQGEQLSWKIMHETNGQFQLLEEVSGKRSILRFYNSKKKLNVRWMQGSNTIQFEISPLPYKEIPLLKDSFHWFSDIYH